MSAHIRRGPVRVNSLGKTASLIAMVLASGCGDNGAGDRSGGAPNLLSARVVAVTEVPNLHRCVAEIGQALQKNPGRAQVDLTCASGTYKGETAAGRLCDLHIDGDNKEFIFTVEREVVRIGFEEVAHMANGAAIHNLENAGTPSQPGIGLTRFTGAPAALTEALILRFEAPLPALPQMIYQRSENGTSTAVICRFGA
jgi:hypothetical protein